MTNKKMKKLFLLLGFTWLSSVSIAQDMAKFNLYKPSENAAELIAKAVAEANAQGKHVLIQVGGNWCIWCARFNDFVNTNASLDSSLKVNYVVYHLNYSKENKNSAVLAKYRFPQRFGYPVLLVLNGKGELIHTQDTSYLEEGKSYSTRKVFEFFKNWSPGAFEPKQYAEQ